MKFVLTALCKLYRGNEIISDQDNMSQTGNWCRVTNHVKQHKEEGIAHGTDSQ